MKSICSDIEFIDENTGAIVGDKGTVLSTLPVTNLSSDPLPLTTALNVAIESYPNPSRGVTTFRFEQNTPSHVDVKVFDILGRIVRHLDASMQARGIVEIVWDGIDDSKSRVPAGIYLVRATSNSGTATGSVVIVH